MLAGRLPRPTASETEREWLVEPGRLRSSPHVNALPVDDPGYRDTVSVPPNGGSITFRTVFADFPGRSVFHCHIVLHSDLGMMAVFHVVRPGDEPVADTAPLCKL